MNPRTGIAYALAAAALFGASAPAVKPLLGTTSPLLAAGLLYLGSGVGLALLRRLQPKRAAAETPLRGRDWLWLGGATLCGGVIGPALLMTGLARTDAATTSLLLNLEALATAVLAWVVFREHASRRTVLGMALILAGAVAIGWSSAPSFAMLAGPLAVAGACLAWAIDNNLTRNIAGSDPMQIVVVKSLVAGLVNGSLGFAAAHGSLPPPGAIAAVALIGFAGYGVSLVLYILALRHLGTARTGAYFSTAPFIGAAIAVAMGSATLDWRFAAAGLLMGTGVWLHATEEHGHEHLHEAMEHEHAHVHDEHHQHAHAPGDPPGEPHAHRHRHERLVHTHPHFPDLHHTHEH